MPTMTLKSNEDGRGGAVQVVEDVLRLALFYGDVELQSKKRFVVETDDAILEAKGSGFKVVDGDLTAGSIKKLDVTSKDTFRGEVNLAVLKDLGDVTDLVRAIEKGHDKGQVAPISSVIQKMKWTIEGTDFNDRMDDATFSGTHNYSSRNVINMGDGNDFVEAGGGRDKVLGGNGQDNIYGGNGNDKLLGGNDEDVIEGDKGNDKIKGGSADDDLDGGTGKDKIDGGAGRDQIQGGGGNDELTGGKDADSFHFFEPDKGSLGHDTILDYDSDEGDGIYLFGGSRLGAEDVSGGVLLEHSFGTIFVKGGDIDDFAAWDI